MVQVAFDDFRDGEGFVFAGLSLDEGGEVAVPEGFEVEVFPLGVVGDDLFCRCDDAVVGAVVGVELVDGGVGEVFFELED